VLGHHPIAVGTWLTPRNTLLAHLLPWWIW